LASGVGHNHGALAIRFKRYEFHGDGSIRGEFSRKGSARESGAPSSGLSTLCGAMKRRTTIARYLEMPELTSGRVRRCVRHHRRRYRLRRCAPALR
jgi:hypothetical protein